MKKRKVCPPGQFCIGSNFLITVLVFVIIILLFYLLRNNLGNNTFLSLNKQDSSDNNCSRKFLGVNKNTKPNNNKTEITPKKIVDEDVEEENKKETHIVIKVEPESQKSYL